MCKERKKERIYSKLYKLWKYPHNTQDVYSLPDIDTYMKFIWKGTQHSSHVEI